MAVELSNVQKSVSFSYDKDLVQGDRAEIFARNPANDNDDLLAPKKSIKNDGSGAVAFPVDYVGQCEIRVEGSEGGEDSGVLEIS